MCAQWFQFHTHRQVGTILLAGRQPWLQTGQSQPFINLYIYIDSWIKLLYWYHLREMIQHAYILVYVYTSINNIPASKRYYLCVSWGTSPKSLDFHLGIPDRAQGFVVEGVEHEGGRMKPLGVHGASPIMMIMDSIWTANWHPGISELCISMILQKNKEWNSCHFLATSLV